jgi:hypothetical protein
VAKRFRMNMEEKAFDPAPDESIFIASKKT